jgi:hypothetical protein
LCTCQDFGLIQVGPCVDSEVCATVATSFCSSVCVGSGGVSTQVCAPCLPR